MGKNVLSSKKPTKTPKKNLLDYNDKTYKSYIENELDVPRNVGKKERIFVARVSDKYPIKRQVKTMIRERILDQETNKMREVLTWTEDWFGRNWVGINLPPVRGHIEGVWLKQNLEPIISEESHEIDAYRSVEPTTVYDYDFNKKNVDEALEKTNTDAELVKFIIKGPGGRRGYATYDQFIDLTWPQCNDILLTSGGFEGAHVKEIMQRANSTK